MSSGLGSGDSAGVIDVIHSPRHTQIQVPMAVGRSIIKDSVPYESIRLLPENTKKIANEVSVQTNTVSNGSATIRNPKRTYKVVVPSGEHGNSPGLSNTRITYTTNATNAAVQFIKVQISVCHSNRSSLKNANIHRKLSMSSIASNPEKRKETNDLTMISTKTPNGKMTKNSTPT